MSCFGRDRLAHLMEMVFDYVCVPAGRDLKDVWYIWGCRFSDRTAISLSGGIVVRVYDVVQQGYQVVCMGYNSIL